MDIAEQLKQRDELVATAHALHPLLAKNADEAERNRRLPDENVKAMIESGMLRLQVPRRAGGFEGGHRTYLDVVSELARSGCGSTAWYGFILNMNDWLTGMMHPEAQEAVWSEGPDTVICCPLTPSPGFTAVKETAGVRLSGKWGYASGCYHSDWAQLGFPITDDAGDVVDMAIGMVPMSAVTIEDTWYVAGMSGTGSNTLAAQDVFVPDNFILTISGPMRNEFPYVPADEHMYRADPAAVFWTCVTPPIIGLAQAALDVTLKRMNGKPKPVSYTLYADSTKAPSTQASVAQAAAMIDAAVLQMRAATDEIDAQSRTGRHFPSPQDRHRQLMRSANAIRLCKGAVDHLLDAQGAGAFAQPNPLQRIWRDLNTAARHGFNAPGIKQEMYGRSLVGADEQQMSLLA